MAAESAASGQKYYVYLVRCADGTFYAGITTDLARRLDEHNGKGAAGAKYTAGRRPVALAYAEEQPDKSSALKREIAIKRLTRAQKEALVAANHAAIVSAGNGQKNGLENELAFLQN